ncbi:TonB-dependent siderophore receptor [Vibrio cincinnatiensis]|nr:TonB-dependent siderophore receptor [Vibrio cincinnatiensis]
MADIRPTRLIFSFRHALCLTMIPCLGGMSSSVLANEPATMTEMETMVISASALKVDTPAQETPKSVSVVTEADLHYRAPQKLDEALRYTAGVMAQPYGADNDTDWLKVRGFDAASYLDGHRLFRDGYYTWLLEPYGLEQIEVLKGPTAILYGEAPPGGVVNAVQKKPTEVPQGEIKLEVGNHNHRGIAFDFSDYANEQGSVRYRLVGAMKNSDGELNGSENHRYYLAPSLAMDLSERTQLTLLASFLEDKGVPTNPFFPAAGTLIGSEHGHIDPSTNLGEPDYDKYERTQISVGYQLEHEWDEVWNLSQRFNYGYNELYLRSSYAFFNDNPEVSELARGVVFRDGRTHSFSLDNQAVAKWYSSRLEHTLLMGLDVQQHKTKGMEQDNYAFGTINPFYPVYGQYNPIDEANSVDRDIVKRQASGYSQYQLKLDQQWVGTFGARYDWVSTDNESHKQAENESRDDNQWSFSAGVMYLAGNGLSPYVSYSQSFDVLSTIDSSTGKLYKPLEGEQTELGIKYTPAFFNGYMNLAWFDITQKNALVTDPATYQATQTGEVTSHGVELESVGYLTKQLKMTASYTFTDAKTEETNGQGKKQAGLIPRHMASLWLDYNAAPMGLDGWNFGSGVRYIGESKDNPKSSDRTVPSATLWDVMVSYDITLQWQAQLNINNVLDKEYVSACDYWCYYGQSRSAVFSANYRW